MAGQLPLAYLTAKTHGLADEAQRIKERLASKLEAPEDGSAAAPLTIDDVEARLPFDASARLLLPPMPFLRNEEGTWPLLAPSRGPFDAFLNSSSADPSQLTATAYVPEVTGTDDIVLDEGGWNDEEAENAPAAPGAVEQAAADAAPEEEGAWDLDLNAADLPQLPKPTVSGPAPVTLPREAPPAQFAWVGNSDVPADHVAAGSFDSAMKLLHTQLAIVNFSPLKSHFLALAALPRTLLAALPSTQPLEVPLHRNWASAAPIASPQNALQQAQAREPGLPLISLTFASLVERLQAGYRAFIAGKFQESLENFRAILHALPLIAASSPSEAAEAKELLGIAVQYVLGLQIELARKEAATQISDPAQIVRVAELSAYFTHCNLQPAHVQLTLRSAMNNAVKLKNFGSAYNYGRRLLDLAPKPEIVATTQRVLQLCEQNALRDEVAIDYDERNPFVICAASMKPIYRGTPSTTCPYCGSHYLQQFNGSTCTVCQLSKVGAPATGLTLFKAQTAAKRPQKRSLLDDN